MKNKFFFLSTIVAACLFAIAYNQSTAQENRPAPQGQGQPSSGASQGQPQGNYSFGGGSHSYSGGSAGYRYEGGENSSEAKPPLMTASTENFTGVVESVNRVSLPNGAQIQLILRTDEGNMLVILGPASFLDQAKIKMQAGDKVTISGYRVSANGRSVILAAQIQKNGSTLQLLDENRKPLWANPQGGPGVQGDQGAPAQGYMRGYRRYRD